MIDLNRRGWYLRLSVTDRCNLRCRYCLPEHARFAPERASTEELLALTAAMHEAVGLRKVRLTGGEPTMCAELVEHVRHAKAMGCTVGLTTNGVELEPLLPALSVAGLDLLNISLDAIDAESFRRISRRAGLERVQASIRAAVRCGFHPVKINCVALQDTDFGGLVRFALAERVHLRFIELMPIGESFRFHSREFVPAAAIRERLTMAGFTLEERRDCDEPTARVWAVDHQAIDSCSVGFITTMSDPFCSTCDRLRLTSQGRLHTCLSDEVGVDLLGPLRAGFSDRLPDLIRSVVASKSPPPLRVERRGFMAAIGG